MSLAERLLSKVAEDESRGCWLWTGSRDTGGYGNIGVNGKSRKAHRMAYQEFRCEIPDGLDLDHLCRVRHCINPYHLQPVTRAVNCIRGSTGHESGLKKRSITHCPSGHEYTPSNTFVDGRGGRHCKICRKVALKKWYLKNRDKQIEYYREWRKRPENLDYDRRRRAAQ